MVNETKEKVTLELALESLTEMCSKLSERVTKVETQIEENSSYLINRHQEITNTIAKLSQEISKRMDEIQKEAKECYAIIKGENFSQQSKEKLNQTLGINTTNNQLLTDHETHFGSDEEEQISKLRSINQFSSTPYIQPTTISILKQDNSSRTNLTDTTRNLQATTVVIPSSSNLPTFSGKYSERPKQFLIRVQEYAETVHNWNQETLLVGISQFLRDTALEWYCQLRASHRRPHSWIEFVDLFLAQFNSPIRSARQQQEWHDCKQRDNETINEFLVRLRAIWMEQKPKESETDLVKHLLCRMRSDLLSMLGVSRNATLDDIVVEAQKVEEILYHRSKAQRRDQLARPSSFCKDTSAATLDQQNRNVNQNYVTGGSNTGQFNTRNNQRFNNSGRFQQNTNRLHNTAQYDRQNSHGWNTTKCYNCGLFGHSTGHCQNATNSNSQTPTQNTKNEYGALAERGNNARSQEIPPLTIDGKIAGTKTQLLIDSGASLTLINQRLFHRLPLRYKQRARTSPPSLTLQLADGSQLRTKFILSLPVSIGFRTRFHTTYVVPLLWRDCIIGNDFIKRHNLQIDGGKQTAYFGQHKQRNQTVTTTIDSIPEKLEYTLVSMEQMKIPPMHAFDIRVKTKESFHNVHDSNEEYEIISLKDCPRVANGIITPKQDIIIEAANLTKNTIMVYVGQPLATMSRLNQMQLNTISEIGTSTTQSTTSLTTDTCKKLLEDSDLDDTQKNQLTQLICDFSDVFSEKTGRTTKVQHSIHLTPGVQPINLAPYRYAPARRRVIEDNIQEMLQEGVIQPSSSPWASPVVLAPKKDGSLRFCVDYRKLNAVTTRDAYPIPRIDDTLDSLQEAKYISTLDLRTGYWQVEMDSNSREKTAFITHKGLFEFNVMPYGLTNAPATFQRLMDLVLAGLKWKCCLVYIDDVIIFSPSFKQHLDDLQSVFQALKAARLTLKMNKCHFCQKEIKYLGHVITRDGIKPDPDLIKAVMDFPQPTKIKDVQSFLGLTGYYRRFIRNYSKIAEPLIKQLRYSSSSNHHLHWSNECTEAFENLKTKLTTAPIMNTPNFNHSFILELDACEYGLGAVLTQEYDGNKYVIAYASRTLSTSERKYGATEREALAIVWATKHFRLYLEGSKVFIRSDCKALEWMRTAKDVTGRLARWAMKLSVFQIENIQYRPGKQNANADALSRNPIPDASTKEIELSHIETAVNLWENTNILDEIKPQQYADPKLKHIIDKLQQETTPISTTKRNTYVLINGLLYRVKNSNRHYNLRELGTKHLLVIPKSMQSKLLAWAHDHPTAGHSGQQKTLFRLTTRVFWESMRKDVFNYVAACNACQQFKYNTTPLANPMQPHIVTEPWQTIGLDLMGPLPTTARQKRFLLVIVDYFTRWVEIFPLSSTTSLDIAQVLINEVFTRYGIPKYILTDNGPQFVSNLFQDICKLLGIERKLTSNYHPQSNMTERVNRTIKPMLAIFAQQKPHSWDKEIQKLAWAIRTSINETTGETPAFMMFGRDPKLPLDLIIGDPVLGPPPTTLELTQINDYKTKLIHNLRCAYTLVNEHSEVEKISQKMKYDQHTTIRYFDVGDLVWVATVATQIGDNTVNRKLQPNYQGPCRIIEKLGPSTFIVQRINDGVILGTTNIDRIKKYFEPITDPQPTDNLQRNEISTEQHTTNNQRAQKSTNGSLPIQRKFSSRQRKLPARYRQ